MGLLVKFLFPKSHQTHVYLLNVNGVFSNKKMIFLITGVPGFKVHCI